MEYNLNGRRHIKGGLNQLKTTAMEDTSLEDDLQEDNLT